MLTEEQAIKLYDSKWWESASDYEIVKFQLFEDKLCVPFDKFHKSIEKIMGRPIWTHEFAYVDNIRKEFLKQKEPPTFEEIMNLIPENKRILIIGD